MLARRLVPCLDVDRGRVVKGIRFTALRDAGDPVECAARYDAEGADELVFLDITASSDARPIVLDMVRRVAEAVYLPFTVGGGVRSVADAEALLRAGADKVAVNTAAVADPELVSLLARRFGSQAVVLAIDCRRVAAPGSTAGMNPSAVPRGLTRLSGSTAGVNPAVVPQGLARLSGSTAGMNPAVVPRELTPRTDAAPPPHPGGGCGKAGLGVAFEVFVRGGRTATGRDAVAWAREGAERGAGEILLTSMDRDGTRDGYDIELTRAVVRAVRVPVVASGGCGSVAHLREVLVEGEASAALAASVFHFGDVPLREARRVLREAGVPVRPQAEAGTRAVGGGFR